MTQGGDVHNEVKLDVRNLQPEDFDSLKDVMERVYPHLGGAWTRHQYMTMLKTFQEGQICIVDNEKVVAAAFSLVVDYDKFGNEHTYDEITDPRFYSQQAAIHAHLISSSPPFFPPLVTFKGKGEARLGTRLHRAGSPEAHAPISAATATQYQPAKSFPHQIPIMEGSTTAPGRASS